jgi:hypothetical protein
METLNGVEYYAQSAASFSALPPSLLLAKFQISSLMSLNSGTPESVINPLTPNDL